MAKLSELVKAKLELDRATIQYNKTRDAFVKENGVGTFENKSYRVIVSESIVNTVSYATAIRENLPKLDLTPYSKTTQQTRVYITPLGA